MKILRKLKIVEITGPIDIIFFVSIRPLHAGSGLGDRETNTKGGTVKAVATQLVAVTTPKP